MENLDLPRPQTDLPLPEKEIPATTGNKFSIFKSKFFIGFVIVSTLIAFLVGGFILSKNKAPENNLPKEEVSTPSIRPTQTENSDENIFCTQDAKLCPDGSYVGRSGPKCEFTPCPVQ